MIYDLPWYTIILTFIKVIDSEHPQNGSGKLRIDKGIKSIMKINEKGALDDDRLHCDTRR